MEDNKMGGKRPQRKTGKPQGWANENACLSSCRHYICLSETTELATMMLNIILKQNATSVAHTFSNILTCYFCVTTVGPLKLQTKMQATDIAKKKRC